MSTRQALDSELRSAELDFSNSIKERLVRYCDELARWNEKINLTGLRGVELVRRLVVEPLWIANSLNIEGNLVDIGSGNGSPAIPLCIARPLSVVHMVEARTRRAVFLRHIATTLKLESARVHNGLFEEVAHEIEPVDWVTLQAVAPTESLIGAIKKIAKPTTKVVWITSGIPMADLTVPFTKTQVRLLDLDQS